MDEEHGSGYDYDLNLLDGSGDADLNKVDVSLSANCAPASLN